MSRILAVQHVSSEGLGRLAPLLLQNDVSVSTFAPEDPIPADAGLGADGLIVLGGPMSVYEAERYPRLRDELRLLEQMLAAQRPVLGICLGSQLLAAALGAAVRPSGKLELGWHEVTPSVEASADELFIGVPRFQALHWHGDVFDLPKSARPLASSAMTRHQAFSYSSKAWGLLFHLEAGPAEVQAMAGAFPEDLHAAGTTADDLLAATAREDERSSELAALVFQRWIDLVVQ
jgi:GMP synthase (glutamine-hydrolysing)